ncbi:hypothetical protein AWB75_01124 [Caballeronia catudaia]|uniref:C2H2-type domain-containing protein n=1 Tax=Caballeronia catudaia TaxID=1777136 RepID=A0A157ZTU4_9BURK|nr:hypothetical protein [Caballeronia catudaia]SAK48337.1 hypothetical protein AWB75_01124 [Caballeronia catudaia]
MEPVFSDNFECFHCHTIFRDGVYEIVHERCRLHFEERVPYVENQDLRGIECYCSRACLEARLDGVMIREKIPVTRPGPDRVANCAVCRLPVDRTNFHRAYLATLSEPVDDITWDTVQMEYLAIICEDCNRLVAGELSEDDSPTSSPIA